MTLIAEFNAAKDHSINLLVRSDVLQQNGFGTFVRNELEDEPQIVTGTSRQGTSQFAFQFVENLRMENLASKLRRCQTL